MNEFNQSAIFFFSILSTNQIQQVKGHSTIDVIQLFVTKYFSSRIEKDFISIIEIIEEKPAVFL